MRLTVLLTLAVPAAAGAAEVKIFRADTRDAVLAGELDSLALDPLGALELAHRVERLAQPEEPFVFTAAGHPDGWVIGTGNSGKVLLVRSTGGVEELYAASEPEIFAVTSGRDGTVYAASSPYGKVYRLPRQGEAEAEAIFEPEDAYIWGLAIDPMGRLLVATGLAGRLYRIDPAQSAGEQTAEILYESADSHVRAIAAMDDGRVLLGTAGQGLVLELVDAEPDRKRSAKTVAVATLYDAVQPEILGFTAGDDGVAYAAVLASEASQVDLSKTQPPPQTADADGESQVTVVSNQETMGSRGSGYTGPRSVVLRIRADGQVDELTSLDDETIHSLLWHDGALWIGTGQEGRLYRYHDERLLLERDLEERQVIALVRGGQGAAAVTANAAGLYRIPGGRVEQGAYTSAVLDAGQVARFGAFLWEGDGSASSLELEARSGMSSKPDATWTAWTNAGSGREIALGELARGRFVQWRATLSGKKGQDGPRLASSELSYRQENLKPQIESFEVMDPGEILVPNNFNPQNQTFEPWSPNREGIFTSLRPDSDKNDSSRLKTLWKKGYRSLKWKASDANEDELRYALAFCRDGSDEPWLEIVEELDDSYYSFDATVLPDGIYRFRLSVSDQAGQGDGEALAADKVSEPVVIDHSPPALGKTTRGQSVVSVELRDALNPLRDVVYSVDASPWKSARVADGLLDGRREVVELEAPADARMLLLRATDAAFNVITFDLSNAD